jgi:cytochrome b
MTAEKDTSVVDAPNNPGAHRVPPVAALPGEQAMVWDLWVRATHWLLVLTVAGAWATRKLPGDWFQWHMRLGYLTLVLVATRLLWGLVGTRHARFANFVRGPVTIWRYVSGLLAGRDVSTAGHNPLGALMVLALLGVLLGQAVTGLFANDADVFEYGPLMGFVTTELSDLLTRWHHRMADVILILVGLHVLAALGYWAIKRDNLILPMITGRKPAAQVPPAERIVRSRLWLALLLAAALAAALTWAVRTAPVIEAFGF